MSFIFKHFGKIFVSIFILSLVRTIVVYAGIGYVAVKLGPKAIDKAEKLLDD